MKRLLLCLLVSVLSCQSNQGPNLLGKWEAFEILEAQIPMELEPKEVRFNFKANGIYQFQSTLGYREAGKFQIHSDFLITTDTIHSDSQEKIVKIQSLQNDTLILLMKKGEDEQIIKLKKII